MYSFENTWKNTYNPMRALDAMRGKSIASLLVIISGFSPDS